MEYKNIVEYATAIARETMECVSEIDPFEAERLYRDVKDAPRVFAWAPGRCGAILRCFIMRLMHLGRTVHFVGDTTTPAIGEGDLLIIAASAGYNVGIASIAERARGFGAKVVLLTIVRESLCQRNSDYTVIIPGATAALGGIGTSIQPGGGKYEESLLILLDAIIAQLNRDLGNRLDKGIKLHANLE
ncbi:MAG: SIS domain-containing protein [Clostridiales bacterium]|nr:SIS domain-containing protein [Clostridiales bacterium]